MRSALRTSFVRIGVVALVLILTAALYLCFWPVPIRAVAWSAPVPPGYVGPHAPNTRLSGLGRIEVAGQFGPEHIAIGPDGDVYAAMTSGAIIRMHPDGGDQRIVARTGGRVLGFAFDAEGRMIAADAMSGLLAITPTGEISLLTNRVGADDPIGYANSVIVAKDGKIYFTDSSTRFAPAAWGSTLQASVLDVLEQSATGRVLAYDPTSRTTRIVAHGLSFANGIALSADERSLLVNETGRYRIWKIDAAADDLDVGSGSPQAAVLVDNLPGYPDNLMRGREGRIWVGLFRPRNPAADSLADKPFIREILLRLPRSMLPLGKPYGHVFAIDESGSVVADLQDPSGAYPETTGATETESRLFIHSLHADAIGWLPR